MCMIRGMYEEKGGARVAGPDSAPEEGHDGPCQLALVLNSNNLFCQWLRNSCSRPSMPSPLQHLALEQVDATRLDMNLEPDCDSLFCL